MSDPVAWYEDPCFDDMHEAVGGKCVRGDAWRRLQFLRERGVAGELIAAAGTTFRAEGVRRGTKRAREGTRLVPEPDNPHDPRALRVEVGGEHVGYVPKGKQLPSPCPCAHVVTIGDAPAPHAWLLVE